MTSPYPDGNSSYPMENLGYFSGKDDIVDDMHGFLCSGVVTKVGDFWRMKGSIPSATAETYKKSLTFEDNYRVDRIIRSFLYQEARIVDALKRLDAELADMYGSSDRAKQIKTFTDSLSMQAIARNKAWQATVNPKDYLAPPSLRSMNKPPGKRPPIIDLYDPEVARPISSVSWTTYAWGRREKDVQVGDVWRLGDNAYKLDRIPDELLRNFVDLVLAVQAEYQLQCIVSKTEIRNVISARQEAYFALDEEMVKTGVYKSRWEGKSVWEIVGDSLGVFSAATGTLALCPILTPIMGPLAVLSAAGTLGTHAVASSIKGDWDGWSAAELGADAIGALPVVGSVGNALKAGKIAMQSAGKMSVAAGKAGQAFLAQAADSAADAGKIGSYLGTKGAGLVKDVTSAEGKKLADMVAKVTAGTKNLTIQVPTTLDLTGVQDLDASKKAATSVDLTWGVTDNIGDWVKVGRQTAGKLVSLERFAKALA
ncbi:hypothetical protein [Streptomyces lavendulae]|uniref:hypothetical protein n=1 Tax=Streptomyces lavendulae TaxID=1914 RepID=UPI0031EB78BD